MKKIIVGILCIFLLTGCGSEDKLICKSLNNNDITYEIYFDNQGGLETVYGFQTIDFYEIDSKISYSIAKCKTVEKCAIQYEEELLEDYHNGYLKDYELKRTEKGVSLKAEFGIKALKNNNFLAKGLSKEEVIKNLSDDFKCG